MSLVQVYQTVLSAWVEGRLENILERQKQLSALHANLKKHRHSIVASLCQVASTTKATASEEVDYTLHAIKKLYDDLDFPESLRVERTIQAGKSASINMMPAGLVLISSSRECPLSSALIPLAAAVAAGCCCLVLLSSSCSCTNEIRGLLQESLDQEAVGAVTIDGPDALEESAELLCVQAAVLQDLTPSDSLSALLQRKNPGIRLFRPSAGHPAIFVDRSVLNVKAVASFIYHRVIKSPRHNSRRVPRLCFVDEFFIEDLRLAIQGYDQGSTSAVRSTKADELVDVLSNAFPSLSRDSLIKKDELCNLIMIDRNDPVNVETIGKIAEPTGLHFPGVILVPIRSLDHGIDLWNKVNSGHRAQVTYIFADSKEAFYYSRFLSSDQFFINDISSTSHVYVAPSTQFSSPELTFRKEDFSVNKSINQVPVSRLCEARPVGSSLPSGMSALNLKRIAQPMGGRLSYFEQGLIVGLGAAAVVALGTSFLFFRVAKHYFIQ